MALAEDFQAVLDTLPPDWTDLSLDLRIFDEERYIEAATILVQINAAPYSKHDWHWRLQVAHQGTLTDWQSGAYLELPRHGIWGRHPSFEPDFLEILLNEIEDGTFRFRRDPNVMRRLDAAFIRAPNGVPILAPEIALLYKSSSLEPDNWSDFRAALPSLDAARRAWLGAALARQSSDHPWLAELEGPA